MKTQTINGKSVPIYDNENAKYISLVNNIVKYIDKIDTFHLLRDNYKISSYEGKFTNISKCNLEGTCDCGMIFEVPFYVISFFCPVCFKVLTIDNIIMTDKITNEIRNRALNSQLF